MYIHYSFHPSPPTRVEVCRAKSSSAAPTVPPSVRPAGSLVDQIGNTPLLDVTDTVRDLIPAGVTIVAKAEWFNPGGSVKDRAAMHMIRDLETRGRLKPGGTILDASSGNTGICLLYTSPSPRDRTRSRMPSSA